MNISNRIILAGLLIFVIAVFYFMSNERVKAQERITAGAKECRDKGGYLLADRFRGGVLYRCIGKDGEILISRNMATGYIGLDHLLDDEIEQRNTGE